MFLANSSLGFHFQVRRCHFNFEGWNVPAALKGAQMFLKFVIQKQKTLK